MASEFGKPIHDLTFIPATVKNIASMGRSIRGSGNLLPEAPTRRLQPFRLKRRGYVSMTGQTAVYRSAVARIRLRTDTVCPARTGRGMPDFQKCDRF